MSIRKSSFLILLCLTACQAGNRSSPSIETVHGNQGMESDHSVPEVATENPSDDKIHISPAPPKKKRWHPLRWEFECHYEDHGHGKEKPGLFRRESRLTAVGRLCAYSDDEPILSSSGARDDGEIRCSNELTLFENGEKVFAGNVSHSAINGSEYLIGTSEGQLRFILMYPTVRPPENHFRVNSFLQRGRTPLLGFCNFSSFYDSVE